MELRYSIFYPAVFSKSRNQINRRQRHHFISKDVYGWPASSLFGDRTGFHTFSYGGVEPGHSKRLEVPLCLLHSMEDRTQVRDEHKAVF
jgi:hypothetical protein